MKIDPTAPVYGASGSNATTKGSISASSNALTVDSPTGWAPGMGIAIAGAGPNGIELVSSVMGVSGLTLMLTAAAQTSVTGAVVNHDDTAALSAALSSGMSSGLPLWLPNGNYNITGNLPSMSSPVSIRGQDIYRTSIVNRGANNSIFTIDYAEFSPFEEIKRSCIIENFQISQDLSIIPSGGSIFTIGAPNGLTTGARIRDIVFNNVWQGLTIAGGQISNWFERLYFRNLLGGNAIFYNSPGPNGDCHFSDIECSGYNTGINIAQSDTMTFTNLKTNFTGVIFSGPLQDSISRVRFINPNIEGDFSSQPSSGFNFGDLGVSQVSIVGGGIGGMPNAFRNLHLNAGGYILTNIYNTSDAFSGWVQYGNLTSI